MGFAIFGSSDTCQVSAAWPYTHSSIHHRSIWPFAWDTCLLCSVRSTSEFLAMMTRNINWLITRLSSQSDRHALLMIREISPTYELSKRVPRRVSVNTVINTQLFCDKKRAHEIGKTTSSSNIQGLHNWTSLLAGNRWCRQHTLSKASTTTCRDKQSEYFLHDFGKFKYILCCLVRITLRIH